MKHHHFSLELAGLLGLALLAFAPGCSDDKDNDRPDPVIPIDTGGKSNGGKSDGGNENDAGQDGGSEGGKGAVSNGGTGNVGNTGASSNDGGIGNEAGSGPIEPPACTLPERGANDCYNCPQNGETVQWLNRCVSGSECVEFDNDERVPLAATVDIDVSLPALP
jgi:hypothetical protein